MQAKTISEEGRQQIGGIGTRVKVVFLAIVYCLLSGSVQQRSDYQ
jgi:hypothetical protein